MSDRIVITPGPVKFLMDPYIENKYVPNDILEYVKKLKKSLYKKKKEQPYEIDKINLYIVFDLYEKMRNKLVFIINKLNSIIFDENTLKDLLKGFTNINIDELLNIPDLRNYNYILPNNEQTIELTYLILHRINIMGQNIDNITSLLSQIEEESIQQINKNLNHVFELNNQIGGAPVIQTPVVAPLPEPIIPHYTGRSLKDASDKLDKILSFVQSLSVPKLGITKMNPIEKKYALDPSNNQIHMYNDLLFQYEKNLPVEKQIKNLTNIINKDEHITNLYLSNRTDIIPTTDNINIKFKIDDIQYEVEPLLSSWGNDIGNILKQFTIAQNDTNKTLAINTYSTIKSIINFINYNFSDSDFKLSDKDPLEEKIKPELDQLGDITQLQQEYNTIKSEPGNISKIYPLEKDMNNQINKLNFDFNKWDDGQQLELKNKKNNISKTEKQINELTKQKEYYDNLLKNETNDTKKQEFQQKVIELNNKIYMETNNLSTNNLIYKNIFEKYNSNKKQKETELNNAINRIIDESNQKIANILGSVAEQKINKIKEIKLKRKELMESLKPSLWTNIFNKTKITELTTKLQTYINNIDSGSKTIFDQKNVSYNKEIGEKNKKNNADITNIITKYRENITTIDQENTNLEITKGKEQENLKKAGENQKQIDTLKQIANIIIGNNTGGYKIYNLNKLLDVIDNIQYGGEPYNQNKIDGIKQKIDKEIKRINPLNKLLPIYQLLSKRVSEIKDITNLKNKINIYQKYDDGQDWINQTISKGWDSNNDLKKNNKPTDADVKANITDINTFFSYIKELLNLYDKTDKPTTSTTPSTTTQSSTQSSTAPSTVPSQTPSSTVPSQTPSSTAPSQIPSSSNIDKIIGTEIIKNELFGKKLGEIKNFINDYSTKNMNDVIKNLAERQNKFKCEVLLNYNSYGIPNIDKKQLYNYGTINKCMGTVDTQAKQIAQTIIQSHESTEEFDSLQKLSGLDYNQITFDGKYPQGVIKKFFEDNLKNVETMELHKIFNGTINFDTLKNNIDNNIKSNSTNPLYNLFRSKVKNADWNNFIKNVKSGIKKKIDEVKNQYDTLVEESKNINNEQIKINIVKKFLEIINDQQYKKFKEFYDNTQNNDFLIPAKDDSTTLENIFKEEIKKIENKINENNIKIRNIRQNIQDLEKTITSTSSSTSSSIITYTPQQSLITDKKWFTENFIYKDPIAIDESKLPKDYLKMSQVGGENFKYYSDTTFLNSRIFDIMYNLNNSDKITDPTYNKLLLDETMNNYNYSILIYILYVLNMCDKIPSSFVPKHILSIDDVNEVLISMRKAMKSDLYKNNEDKLKIVFGRTEKCYNKMALLLNNDTTKFIDVIKSNSIIDILLGNHIMTRLK